MRTIAEMLRWRTRRHPSQDAVWFDGGRVRIVDSEGCELPPYEVGEILLPG